MDRDAVGMATLDAADDRPRNARLPAKLALGPPASHPKGPKPQSETNDIHIVSLAGTTSPRLIRTVEARARPTAVSDRSAPSARSSVWIRHMGLPACMWRDRTYPGAQGALRFIGSGVRRPIVLTKARLRRMCRFWAAVTGHVPPFGQMRVGGRRTSKSTARWRRTEWGIAPGSTRPRSSKTA